MGTHNAVSCVVFLFSQDASNSTDVVHKFELVATDSYEEEVGTVQLRAEVRSNYCYLAFGGDFLPLHKTCSSKVEDQKLTAETVFSIVPV